MDTAAKVREWRKITRLVTEAAKKQPERHKQKRRVAIWGFTRGRRRGGVTYPLV